MKKLIAHRGNHEQINTDDENTIPYLWHAISQGYDVEVDVWYTKGKFYSGHDEPTHLVTQEQIERLSHYAWYHAKNYEALAALLKGKHHVFTHDQDPFTITSKGIIWSHKGNMNPYGIVCMPDLENETALIFNAYGICHDFLEDVVEFLANGHPQ